MLYFFDGFCGLLAVYQELVLCRTVCSCNNDSKPSEEIMQETNGTGM